MSDYEIICDYEMCLQVKFKFKKVKLEVVMSGNGL